MRGVDPAVLLSYSWFCVAAASHLGIEVTKKLVTHTCFYRLILLVNKYLKLQVSMNGGNLPSDDLSAYHINKKYI